MESVIRLLPFADADGATNMAADEALLRSAALGVASLRFYGWTAATVSLGYFQPHSVRLADFRFSALPWVRRPSGGATLVHDRELTYALTLPAGSPWQSAESWLVRMHRTIAAALTEYQPEVQARNDAASSSLALGVGMPLVFVGKSGFNHGDVLCFQQHTPGDVLCGGHKIVGSAQRKHRQALMQHGSILLAQSEHTPALPGIRELAGVNLTVEQLQQTILRRFSQDTRWRIESDDWTTQEKTSIEELRQVKYAAAAWNQKR